jgi:hypothetical protein
VRVGREGDGKCGVIWDIRKKQYKLGVVHLTGFVTEGDKCF